MEFTHHLPTLHRQITSRMFCTLAVLATIAATLVLGRPEPASASTATYWVSPTGQGHTCTEREPCQFINTAFELARPGDVIKLVAGVHPSQAIVARKDRPVRAYESDNVLVVPAGIGDDVRFAGPLFIGAPNITISGMRGGDFRFGDTAHYGVFENGYMVDGDGIVRIGAANRIIVRKSTITGGVDRDNVQIADGTGHIIEDNVFGGVGLSAKYLTTEAQNAPHPDSIQILGGSDIIVRRNIIHGSLTHAVFVRPDLASIENLVFEDNTVRRCSPNGDRCSAHFSLHVMAADEDGKHHVNGVTLTGNTVFGATIIRLGVTGSEARGNVFEEYNLELANDGRSADPASCIDAYGPSERNIIGTTNCPKLAQSNRMVPPR